MKSDTRKTVTIGPFPPSFMDRLTGPLKENGIDFQLQKDPALIEAYRQRRLQETPNEHRTYQAEDTLYLTVPLEGVMATRPDLEKLGIVLRDTDFDPGFDSKSYLCTKCEHEASHPGECPKHKIALIEFSEFAEKKMDRASRRERLTTRLIVILIVLVAAFGALAFLYPDLF